MTLIINRYNCEADEVINDVQSVDFICAGTTGQKLQIYALKNKRLPLVIERFIGLGDYCSIINAVKPYSY